MTGTLEPPVDEEEQTVQNVETMQDNQDIPDTQGTPQDLNDTPSDAPFTLMTDEGPSVSYIYKGSVVFLFFCGMLTFFLYKQPTENSMYDECGMWLAELLGSVVLARTLLFILGSGAVSLMNAYFSAHAPENLAKMDEEIKSPAKRKAAKIAAVGLGIIANATSATSALSNNSSFPDIMMAYAGTLASRLAKASELVRQNIPHFLESASQKIKRINWGILRCCIGLNEQQINAQAVLLNKIENQKKLIKCVEANWHRILEKISNQDSLNFLSPYPSNIEILAAQDAMPEVHSNTKIVIHELIKLVPKIGVVMFVIGPIVCAAEYSIEVLLFQETSWKSIVVTGLASSIESLLLYKIACGIGEDLSSLVDSIFNKKIIYNLTHKLYPWKTAFTKFFLGAAASASFANLCECFIRRTASHIPYRFFKIPGMVMVDFFTAIYHYYPTYKGYDNLMELIERNPDYRKLYSIQNEVKKVHDLSVEEAHQYILKMPKSIQIKWQIAEVDERIEVKKDSLPSVCAWCCHFSLPKQIKIHPEPPRQDRYLEPG